MSCVLRMSSAAWGEETTITGTFPRRMDIMGPYFLAKVWRARWGRAPKMWRLPMIGKARGPGGSLRLRFWFCVIQLRMNHSRVARRRKIMVMVKGDMFGMCMLYGVLISVRYL